jgi:hypothetical protein
MEIRCPPERFDGWELSAFVVVFGAAAAFICRRMSHSWPLMMEME